MPEKTVLSTGEVATALSVTRETVVSWIEAGKLQAFKLPSGVWRIYRTEIERIMTPSTQEAKQV